VKLYVFADHDPEIVRVRPMISGAHVTHPKCRHRTPLRKLDQGSDFVCAVHWRSGIG
jgi:hypothetical protein